MKRGLSDKAKKQIKKDEEFYELIFNTYANRCAECDFPLNDVFRDDGRVVARWQYSHNLPKSTHPHLRHHPLNMERLCLKHHEQYEAGGEKRKKMKIWKIVEKKIKKMLQQCKK